MICNYFTFCKFQKANLSLNINIFFFIWTAENDPHDGKRKCETLWPIFKIAHQKSRYVFDLYHRRKEISPELYEFCLDQGYADRNIIAKWKKARKITDFLFSFFPSFSWLLKSIYGFEFYECCFCNHNDNAWFQAGYERLCCLRCIQPRDHNFQTTCVCRVPKHLREEKVIECVHCGCKGCASGDWSLILYQIERFLSNLDAFVFVIILLDKHLGLKWPCYVLLCASWCFLLVKSLNIHF